jgi:hypothetical protein
MTTFIDATDGCSINSSITLGLKLGDDGKTYGRIIGMGLPVIISTFPNDPPIEAAIGQVSELARTHGVTVIRVLDEERLWQPAWGSLHKEAVRN